MKKQIFSSFMLIIAIFIAHHSRGQNASLDVEKVNSSPVEREFDHSPFFEGHIEGLN